MRDCQLSRMFHSISHIFAGKTSKASIRDSGMPECNRDSNPTNMSSRASSKLVITFSLTRELKSISEETVRAGKSSKAFVPAERQSPKLKLICFFRKRAKEHL